jgi:hypothetical protein
MAIPGQQLIITHAAQDARTFVSEFPGETLAGSDWDAEAFAQLPARLREIRDAWDIYRLNLWSQVATLNARRELAQAGGKAKSKVKAAAARANGTKGGRPKKQS